MITQIIGTTSWISDITGKTYSSKRRAEAAERASERLKEQWEERRKASIIDEDFPYDTFDWEDLDDALDIRTKRKEKEWNDFLDPSKDGL